MRTKPSGSASGFPAGEVWRYCYFCGWAKPIERMLRVEYKGKRRYACPNCYEKLGGLAAENEGSAE